MTPTPTLAHVLYPVLVISILYFLTRKAGKIITGRIAWQVFIAVSALGTLVHELSHALTAGLFGHKIIAFKPFLFDLNTGTLGSVETQYSSKRTLHVVGVFFMSIAPLFLGTLLIYLLLIALVPNAQEIIELTNHISQHLGALRLGSVEKGIVGAGKLVAVLFAPGNLSDIMFWIFLALSFSIAIHLVPSNHDFRNMVPGTIGLGLMIFVVGSSNRVWLVDRCLFWLGNMLNNMLTLTLMFTIIYFLLTLLAAAIVTFVRKWRRCP